MPRPGAVVSKKQRTDTSHIMISLIFAWGLLIVSIPGIALLRLAMTHGSINIGSFIYYIIYQSILSVIILTFSSIGGILTPGEIAMTAVWLLCEAIIGFVFKYVKS
jgi:hypothetical protein